jgi:hypothetical protein
MANRKLTPAKGKPRRKASFSNLLKTAPKIKSFRKATISGVLFQSEQRDKFVLQTAEGIHHELNIKSVEQYRVLGRRGEFTVVEIEVPTRELSEGAAFSRVLMTNEQFAEQLSKLPPHLSDPKRANVHLNAFKEDLDHPIHQYWQFGRKVESPFREFSPPFPPNHQARS